MADLKNVKETASNTKAGKKEPWSTKKKTWAATAVLAFGAAAGGGYYYADQEGYIDQYLNPTDTTEQTVDTPALITDQDDKKPVVSVKEEAITQPLPQKTLDDYMAAADADKGQGYYGSYCTGCHSTPRENGSGGMGPNLFNVVGSEQGLVGSRNSKALRETLTGTWDRAALDEWLENPRDMVPGTSMYFAGLKDPQMRADIISYLETKKPQAPKTP